MSGEIHSVAQFNMLDVEAQIKNAQDQIEDRAKHLLDSATKKSRELLQKAIEDREKLFVESKDAGHKEGYDKGFEEGFKAGEEKYVVEHGEELKKSTQDLKVFLEQVPERINKGKIILEEAFEQHFLSLAFEVASLAVQRDIKDNGSPVTDLLKEMMQQVLDHHHIMVETHPDNVKALEKFIPTLRNQFADIGQVNIRGVQMDKDQVTVRTEKGHVEASPELMLQRLKKEWKL